MVKWCNRRILLVLILVIIAILITYHLTLSSHRHDLDNHTGHLMSLSDLEKEEHIDDMQLILHVALRIWHQGKPVLITVVNDAYLPFAHSWLCNTVYMDVHEQALFIVTDSKSRDTLARQWPNIHVITLSGQQDLSGNQIFSHAGYMRIMIRRTEIIQELLNNDIEVILFEVDCVWLMNPIPECQKQVQGYDMVATAVTDRPDLIGGGFLYLKPTFQLCNMWQKLTDKLIKLKRKIEFVNVTLELSDRDNDQTYLSRLINNGNDNVRVNVMSLDSFADGKWYSKVKAERSQLRPFIINNNWVSKNKAKIRRARKFHHWFWKNSAKCDLNLVKATIY